MICGRLPLIVIYSALSGLVSSGSLATEFSLDALAREQATEIIEHQWDLQSSRTSHTLTSEIQQKAIFARYQTVSQLSTESSRQSVTVESSVKINKPLFIIAMAVTSTISMFLLWVLFRKPSEVATELTTVSEAVVLPEDELEAKKEPKEPAEISSVSDTSIKQDHHAKNALSQNLLDSQTNEQPTVEKLSPSGSLVKINESEEYIDVVFELTQDLQSSDRNVRRKAIWELAKLGDSRVIKPLMAIMPQANSVDKSLIVKAVTQIANRSFKPVNAKLFTMLNDSNPQVRVNAILDLTAFYKFVLPVTQQLSKMQFDSDPQVRQTATRALQNWNLNYPVSMTPVRAKNQVSDIAVGKKNQAN